MSICPLSAKAVAQVAKGKIEPVFVQKDEQRKMYFVYADPDVIVSAGMMKNGIKTDMKAVDVIQAANKVGRIDLPAGADTSKLDELISADYSMALTGMAGNLITAEIEINDKTAVKADSKMSGALEEAWKNALALGAPFTQDFMDTVMEFFNLHSIDESLRLEVVKGYEEIGRAHV